jgi:hypothetical protein
MLTRIYANMSVIYTNITLVNTGDATGNGGFLRRGM